jgi:hypothetical protein
VPVSIFLGEFYQFSSFLKVWRPKKLFLGKKYWVTMGLIGTLKRVPQTGISRVKRHNIIRDILFEFCSAAAWGPVKEKLFLFPGCSE